MLPRRLQQECSKSLKAMWEDREQTKEQVRKFNGSLDALRRQKRSWFRMYLCDTYGGDMWAYMVLATGTINDAMIDAYNSVVADLYSLVLGGVEGCITAFVTGFCSHRLSNIII